MVDQEAVKQMERLLDSDGAVEDNDDRWPTDSDGVKNVHLHENPSWTYGSSTDDPNSLLWFL